MACCAGSARGVDIQGLRTQPWQSPQHPIRQRLRLQHASTATNTATIAQNFDTFLQLLTTQLKNQNPLDPLDTNQFTQQLVQFAQVEQQINMNSSLNTADAAADKPDECRARLPRPDRHREGDTAKLTNGQAGWSFTPRSPAPRPYRSRARPARLPIRVRSRSAPDHSSSTGTAKATTAPNGPTEITRSRSSPRTPTASRLRSRPR